MFVGIIATFGLTDTNMNLSKSNIAQQYIKIAHPCNTPITTPTARGFVI